MTFLTREVSLFGLMTLKNEVTGKSGRNSRNNRINDILATFAILLGQGRVKLIINFATGQVEILTNP